MAFNLANFSPVGNNARAGNVPQVFAYRTADEDSVVVVPDYFQELSKIIRRGDWIDVATIINDAAPEQFMHFFLGDGSTPSTFEAAVAAGGTGYAVGDLTTVTFTGATETVNTLLEVLTITGSAATSVAVVDPGLFTVLPTGLAALPTVAKSGSGTGLTVNITLATLDNENDGIVTLAPQVMSFF